MTATARPTAPPTAGTAPMPDAPSTDARTRSTPTAGEDRARSGRARWPLAGVVGGVTGLASVVAAMSTNQITEEEANTGVDAIQLLDRSGYHVGFVLGLVSVGTLLVAASGWRRWADEHAPRDLAARTIGAGVALTATVTSIFACFMGALALYLPGGTDHGWQPDEQLFVTWSLLDFGILLAWWGVAVSAICAATLAFGRSSILPRWMGVTSVVLLVPPVAMALTTGLPGFVGLTMPIWLVVVSIGMVVSKRVPA